MSGKLVPFIGRDYVVDVPLGCLESFVLEIRRFLPVVLLIFVVLFGGDGVSAETIESTIPSAESPALTIEQLGSFDGTTIDAIAVNGDIVYAADGPILRALDISDPTNITQIGSFTDNASSSYSIKNVAAEGSYVYISQGPIVYRINAGDPTNLTLSGTLVSDIGDREIRAMLVEGSIGYISFYNAGTGGYTPQPEGIETVHMTMGWRYDSATTPYYLTARPVMRSYASPMEFVKNGDFIYSRISYPYGNLWTVNVGNVNDIGTGGITKDSGADLSIAIAHDTLYAVHRSYTDGEKEHLLLRDIAAPNHYLSTYADVKLAECAAVVASDGCELARLIAIDTDDDHAWMLTSEGLRAYSLGDPMLPTRIASNGSIDGSTVTVANGMAFVTDREDGDLVIAQLAEQDVSVTEPTCGDAGLISYFWDEVYGYDLTEITGDPRYPDSPTSVDSIRSFDAPRDVGNYYAKRFVGYLKPAVTGAYRFHVAGDDNAELWLGTSDSAESAISIASIPEWTYAEEWDKHPSQTSGLITLQAGELYYIEALYKEFGGNDHFTVGWEVPGNEGNIEIIGETSLCQIADGSNTSQTPTSVRLRGHSAETVSAHLLIASLITLLIGTIWIHSKAA